jgi:Trypsin-co-occurring domain 1
MSTITQIQLPDGQVIYARISGQVPSAGDDDIAHDVGFTEKIPKLASEQLTKLAEGVVSNVRQAVSQFDADEVSIDFGIEFTGKTGRVIGVLAEVGGTASVVLHLTWRGDKGPPPQG